jgi:TctA family transporter
LSQNYPNPFNPSTEIKFSLPEASNVKLTIYDAIGKQVAVLVNDYLATGSYRYTWNASNLASGIYFYRIEAKNFNMVKKMVLLK